MKSKSKRRITAKLIKRIPFNSLRILLYRNLLGYKIGSHVRIGRSILLCNSVKIGNYAAIAGKNLITCKSFQMGERSKINSGNTITGGGSFSIGLDSRVINDHYFDVSRDISIGNKSWIAGRGSQFWTHGSLSSKKPNIFLGVEIKDNVYVGSGVIFTPGVRIKSKVLIGAGSVVHRLNNKERDVILGNPARIVKEDVYWRNQW